MFQKNWKGIFNISKNTQNQPKNGHAGKFRIQRFWSKLKSPQNMPFFSSNWLFSWKKKKKACFGATSIWTKIVVSGLYRRGHFLVDFEYFLKCWKYPSNFSETFKILFFHENNQFDEKKGMFWGLFNLDQNRCIRNLPAWPFFGWFWVFFEMLKIPFQFFWNIRNFVLSWKQSVWRKKKHILGTFQFGPKSLYPDLTVVSIFWLISSIYWNVEITLPILVKHSKFCSFIKTISLKKKKLVLGTFQFSAKSLYPDLTGVAFFWLILSIFWNVENTLPIFLKHSNSVWRKKSMFLGLFNFRQNRCIRTLPAWQFFGWFRVFFYMLKIPFQFSGNIQNFVPILLKHSKFVLSWKQSVWRKKSIFLGLFNFRQNRCVRTLPAWPFFGWFWVFFEMLKIRFQFLWNIQNFVLTYKFSLKKKTHVFGTFQFRPKSLYPDITGVAIFWLILSIFWSVENTHPILVKHSKFCSFMKTISLKKKKWCFGDFSIWTKIALSGHYRCGHFLVDFEYFLKCWKYPSNFSETFKILFFHENNQFEQNFECFRRIGTKFWMFHKNWKGIFNNSKNTQNQPKNGDAGMSGYSDFAENWKVPKTCLFFLQTDCVHERTKFWMFQKNWKGIFKISKNTQNQLKKGHAGKVRIQRFWSKLKCPQNMPFFPQTDCFHERTKFWMFQKNWNKILNVSQELEGYFQHIEKYSKSTKKRPRR